MQSPTVDQIFSNEADPAFHRRARWIDGALRVRFKGQRFSLADIGCGRGFYFPLYAELGADFVGIEPDAGPFDIALARAQRIGGEVVAAEATRLPLLDGAFDAVVMSEVLEHLADPAAALSEARRILAPGGLLLVTVPHANYPFWWDPLNWTLQRTIGRPIRSGPLAGVWANHLRLYSGAELREAVEGGDFRIEEITYQTRHSMPFIHNLVYGLGKPLLERRLLPGEWARSAERATGGSTPRRNPVALGIAIIHWFDRANGEEELEGAPSLNICLRAVAA